jgi:hypothetical protein
MKSKWVDGRFFDNYPDFRLREERRLALRANPVWVIFLWGEKMKKHNGNEVNTKQILEDAQFDIDSIIGDLEQDRKLKKMSQKTINKLREAKAILRVIRGKNEWV